MSDFLSFEAFLLSLASSTDNFMVGLSVGISQRRLRWEANVLISICNATGAGMAGHLGEILQQYLPAYLAPLLAALAFGILAGQEWVAFCRAMTKTKKNKDQNGRVELEIHPETIKNLDTSRALQLALPMTLNNFAGGVAGGAVGVVPWQATSYALMASFLTMTMGYAIGQYVAQTTAAATTDKTLKFNHYNNQRRFYMFLDPAFVSGSLFGVLCLMSLHEAWVAAL